MNKFEHLFTPFNIGKVEIKNRITLSPMGSGASSNSSGSFSDHDIEYYTRRAAGGVGLIVTGAVFTDCVVDNYLEGKDPQVVSLGDQFIHHNPHLFGIMSSRLVDNIHAFGAKLFLQVSFGHGRAFYRKAPSPLPLPGMPECLSSALSTAEIKQKIGDFIAGVVLAKKFGYDGVEVHGMHFGFLLDQFSISFFNKRTDAYGGSFENRHRILSEMIEGIKTTCGDDFPVTLRLGLKSYLKDYNTPSLHGDGEVGRTLEEGLKICRYLEQLGYDALGVDSGITDSKYWHSPPMYQPKGLNLKLAAEAKKAVKIPIMVAGRMNDPDLAEKAIAEGMADAIALGRSLMADPDWPNKVRAGQVESIRPCLSCQVCTTNLIEGKELSCAVNPECRHELINKLIPTLPAKNILIAGGGIAGLEAARAATIRGHKVTVYEKSDKLGGNVIPAGMPLFKEDDHLLIRYYETQLKKLGITVIFNKEVTAELVSELKPDSVIIATGSQPIMPGRIPGIDHKKSVSCVKALLESDNDPSKSIVVVGGGLVGCEYALYMAQKGKTVTIVEALPDILKAGKRVAPPAEAMMRDMLLDLGVKVITSASVAAVNDEGAVIKTDQCEQNIAADRVVWAIGFRSVHNLLADLNDLPVEAYIIGDGKQARTIQSAVFEGYQVGRFI